MYRFDRRKRYGQTDWRITHAAYLQQWENRQRLEPDDGPVHRLNNFIEYLRWYYGVTRAFLKPALPNTDVPVANLPDTDDEGEDFIHDYDRLNREGTQVQRGQYQNYMVRLFGTTSFATLLRVILTYKIFC